MDAEAPAYPCGQAIYIILHPSSPIQLLRRACIEGRSVSGDSVVLTTGVGHAPSVVLVLGFTFRGYSTGMESMFQLGGPARSKLELVEDGIGAAEAP